MGVDGVSYLPPLLYLGLRGVFRESEMTKTNKQVLCFVFLVGVLAQYLLSHDGPLATSVRCPWLDIVLAADKATHTVPDDLYTSKHTRDHVWLLPRCIAPTLCSFFFTRACRTTDTAQVQ